jgi:hypothetical protein
MQTVDWGIPVSGGDRQLTSECHAQDRHRSTRPTGCRTLVGEAGIRPADQVAITQVLARLSSMRWMIGARMISMANPIFPPGTTMVLRRDMNDSRSMPSR